MSKRKQPNLKQFEWDLTKIAFGMTDPRAGAHDLNIARSSVADVAGTVFVRDSSLPYIRDDFHFGMRVTTKTLTRSDLVIVPNYQSTKRTICRIPVSGNYKVVTCFEPSVIGGIECLFRSELQHLDRARSTYGAFAETLTSTPIFGDTNSPLASDSWPRSASLRTISKWPAIVSTPFVTVAFKPVTGTLRSLI